MGAWDDIEDNWDLLRYYAIKRHWETVAPPIDVLMAQWVGWRPPRAVNAASGKGDLGELLAMFSDTGGVIN